MFVSYAQNFEDVLLWRALNHVGRGFYIDIGAHDPSIDSVSRAFYEHGWRGVHVEPVGRYAESLRAARPDEEVVEAAIATTEGVIPFFDVLDTGLSTGKADVSALHEREGFEARRIEVASLRLATLLDRYAGRDIHWLKIDVEDMERDVLESWAPSPVRPWVVVIESTVPLSPEPNFSSWETLILDLGYEFAYFDGLNRFYVHESRIELKEKLQFGANIFDGFNLSIDSFCMGNIKAETERLRQHLAAVEAAHAQERDALGQEIAALRASMSWRVTAPLRSASRAARRLWRGPRWFGHGVWAWVTLKPGSRPRRVARAALTRIAGFILRRPGLSRTARRAVRMLPVPVQDRLRSIVMAGASAPSTRIVRPLATEDVSELSARGREIYMLLLAERSARGLD